MKKMLSLLAILLLSFAIKAQVDAPIALMLAYQQKFEGISHFSGTLRYQKQHGEPVAGSFVVDGEKYHIVFDGGEIIGDGNYEWEIMHRSKRIKKNHYDPFLAPSVLSAFRFLRLDLTAEPVQINGKGDYITLDIEYGTSIVQGAHLLKINQGSLLPDELIFNMDGDGFYEKCELANIHYGEEAQQGDFEIDPAAWKAKGYTLLDMAKKESDVIWPEERALR